MNLRLSKGKVPIKGRGETPYLMVNFPSNEVFKSIYKGHKRNIDMYWDILNSLKDGSTMADAGKPHSLTRERVRQIEARFIRAVGEKYWRDVDGSINCLQSFEQNTFSMLETHETSQHEDGSH